MTNSPAPHHGSRAASPSAAAYASAETASGSGWGTRIDVEIVRRAEAG
ncbi:MAG TPA: hypothetical protein VGB24_03975 [Longimicrobium sp.]